MGLERCVRCETPVAHGHFVNNNRLCFMCKFKYDRGDFELKDIRYKTPKVDPSVSQEEIQKTIEENEIYSEVSRLMHKAQEKQVGYGLDKYPEPLTADTWTIIETLDHIIEETVDKLHYMVMLKIKLTEKE